MALLAARLVTASPRGSFKSSGWTGTNGKTTDGPSRGCHLCRCRPAVRAAQVPSSIASAGRDSAVKLTTAESLDLQRMFREMVTAGDRACALEISSHAPALERAVA